MAIDLLKMDHQEYNPEVNENLFDGPKSTKGELIDEIRLKAEVLRGKKRKKATLLSFMRAGSTLMLFLSLAIYQTNFYLYLALIIVGCVTLGISTFVEKGT